MNSKILKALCLVTYHKIGTRMCQRINLQEEFDAAVPIHEKEEQLKALLYHILKSHDLMEADFLDENNAKKTNVDNVIEI